MPLTPASSGSANASRYRAVSEILEIRWQPRAEGLECKRQQRHHICQHDGARRIAAVGGVGTYRPLPPRRMAKIFPTHVMRRCIQARHDPADMYRRKYVSAIPGSKRQQTQQQGTESGSFPEQCRVSILQVRSRTNVWREALYATALSLITGTHQPVPRKQHPRRRRSVSLIIESARPSLSALAVLSNVPLDTRCMLLASGFDGTSQNRLAKHIPLLGQNAPECVLPSERLHPGLPL